LAFFPAQKNTFLLNNNMMILGKFIFIFKIMSQFFFFLSEIFFDPQRFALIIELRIFQFLTGKKYRRKIEVIDKFFWWNDSRKS